VTERIDGHVHLWDPDARRYDWLRGLDALDRVVGPAELERVLAPAGFGRAVLVQALPTDEETDACLALAAATPSIAAVVGWADVGSPGLHARLEALRGGSVRAIRLMAQDEPDPEWLTRPEVMVGARAVAAVGFAVELLVRPPQRHAALELARRLPEARIVLDHGGKPAIHDGEWGAWLADIHAFAALPNVVAKLSGLVTEAGSADPAPYARAIVDAFGAARLIFGSDWPVCTLSASHDEVVALADAATSHLSSDERTAVFGGTAAAVYGL
jgi:L-fuconolactonase